MHRFLKILSAICLLTAFLSACTPETASSAVASVRINEVLTSGGDYDWVELYNAGNITADMTGCFLSDNPDNPGKWEFNDIKIPANGYLLLRADGKKIREDVDGLHLFFSLKASGETLLLSDHNGTLLQKLEIPSAISGLSYGCDESATDNPYVWYASPTPGASNMTGMMLGKEAFAEENGLLISEYMSSNRSSVYDESGDYPDWLELYNVSDKDIDLCGYTLTDSQNNLTKWVFPQSVVLPAGGYLLIYCSGKDTVTPSGECHTNFKLGDQDSFVGLFTPQGALCSGISCRPVEQGQSLIYTEAGGYTLCRYPTPGYINPHNGDEVR